MNESCSSILLLQRRLGVVELPTPVINSEQAMSALGIFAQDYLSRTSSLLEIQNAMALLGAGEIRPLRRIKPQSELGFLNELSSDSELEGYHQENKLYGHFKKRYENVCDIWNPLQRLMFKLNIMFNKHFDHTRHAILFASDFIYPSSSNGQTNFEGAQFLAKYTDIQTQGIFDNEPKNWTEYLTDDMVNHVFSEIVTKMRSRQSHKVIGKVLSQLRNEAQRDYFQDLSY